jgi:hypothetical protein
MGRRNSAIQCDESGRRKNQQHHGLDQRQPAEQRYDDRKCASRPIVVQQDDSETAEERKNASDEHQGCISKRRRAQTRQGTCPLCEREANNSGPSKRRRGCRSRDRRRTGRPAGPPARAQDRRSFQPELAMGAVVDGGHPHVIRNEDIIALADISAVPRGSRRHRRRECLTWQKPISSSSLLACVER